MYQVKDARWNYHWTNFIISSSQATTVNNRPCQQWHCYFDKSTKRWCIQLRKYHRDYKSALLRGAITSKWNGHSMHTTRTLYIYRIFNNVSSTICTICQLYNSQYIWNVYNTRLMSDDIWYTAYIIDCSQFVGHSHSWNETSVCFVPHIRSTNYINILPLTRATPLEKYLLGVDWHNIDIKSLLT